MLMASVMAAKHLVGPDPKEIAEAIANDPLLAGEIQIASPIQPEDLRPASSNLGFHRFGNFWSFDKPILECVWCGEIRK
jgi:hypothetical protein